VIAVPVSGLILVALLWGESMLTPLKQLLGTRSPGRQVTAGVLGLLVLLALVIALDPEVRILLLLLDAIGVDVFLLLLTFQGREYLQWLGAAVIVPIAQRLSMWGPYPMPLPTRWLVTQHPFWSAYATAQLMALAALIALAAVGIVSAVSLTITWPAGKVLGAVALRTGRRGGEVHTPAVNIFRGRDRRRWWLPVPRSAPGRLH
jgi:hypothetical protein